VCERESPHFPYDPRSLCSKDKDRELSLASLVQAQRVVLDTVKLLDRDEGGDDGPPPMTAEELEELLARTTPKPDA
jgi:hypothetical protein